MLLIYIVGISVLIQLITAFLALRLIKIIGKQLFWIFLAIAFVLQVLRRILTLIGLITGDIIFTQVAVNDWIGLCISILMLAGVAGIGSVLFKSERNFRDRKIVEEVLRKSEEKYRYMFENNPQPMWIYDLATLKFLEVNETAVHYYGYTREEFLSMTLKDIRPAEDVEALIREIEKSGNNYNPASEWRHLKKNGEIINVEIISHPVDFNNHKARHVMVTDITDRKSKDKKIKDSEEKFRSLFKKSPFGIAYHEMIFDDSGTPIDYRFLEVNEAFINIIGIDPTGRKVTDAFPGIDKYSFNWIGTYGKVVQTGEQIHFEQYFDSTSRLYDCVAFRSEKNQYAVIFQDITERRIAEDKINRLNERILTATHSVQLGIWDWDIVNNRLVWDDQMYKLYGINKESFSGAYETWLNGLHPDDRELSEKESEEALTGRKDYDTEFRVLWPDGSIHFLKTKGKVVWDEHGNPARMIGINYDITTQKLAEEELRNTKEALEKLNQWMNDIREDERASLARELHDRLGQSLTALRIDADWLHRFTTSNTVEDEKVKEMIGLISSMIIDVQRISSELRPSILDDLGLVPAMEWYILEFEKRTGIRCLLNLNDVQFTNEKKNLVVYRILQEALTNVVRHSDATKVNVNLYSTTDSIILEVIDNGKGLEKEKISSYKSLGFVGIRERLKQHNGSLDIHSIINKETRLSIMIPFS